MRTRVRADRIVTNVLRQVASELNLPSLSPVVNRRLVRGSRFQLHAKDYGGGHFRDPLYEQVCRIDGGFVFWKTVYPGNRHVAKRRAAADWVIENARIVRR